MTRPEDMPAPYDGPPLVVGWIGNYSKPWCSEQHFTASMESLGHRVVRWQENTLDWATLAESVRAEGVQLVCWTRTWPVGMDVALPVLDELRTMGVPTASVHLDRWFGLDREHQVDDQPFFRTALVVSPDDSPKWAEHGVNHLWMPPGVYGPECEPVPPDRRRFPHDVVFVGSHPYPHAEWEPYRSELIRRMQAEFGRRFAVWPRRGQPIRGRNLQTLYASAKVVVGDSCLAGETHQYVSDRVPETLGRGGLLIHPAAEWMEDWWVSGHDLITYEQGDFAGAVEAARMALDNPDHSREIAEHGRTTVLARDTYAHRMASLLGHVAETLGIGPSVPVSRPQPVAAPVPAPAPIRVRHANTGVRATLTPCAADGTDATAIRETWTDDQYRLTKAQVRGRTVVDVGANVGAFSILAAKAGARRVVAYEPHPESFETLQRNVADNGLTGVIECRRLAIVGSLYDMLAATDETAPLRSVALVGHGGGAHALSPLTGVTPDQRHGRDPDFQHVPAMTVDEAFADLGPIGYAKLDCEGGEDPIVRGIDPALLDQIERIVMEFHGPGMPHLAHLNGDGLHIGRWGMMVAKLANHGRVEIFGRPMVGGIIRWERF